MCPIPLGTALTCPTLTFVVALPEHLLQDLEAQAVIVYYEDP